MYSSTKLSSMQDGRFIWCGNSLTKLSKLISEQDLAPGRRTIDTHMIDLDLVTPQGLLSQIRNNPDNAGAEILNQDINVGIHGTVMATLAGGLNHGMAPRANMYLIKAKGQYRYNKKDPRTGQPLGDNPDHNMPYNTAALLVAFNQIRAHIADRISKNPDAKSVINLSWGKFGSRTRRKRY